MVKEVINHWTPTQELRNGKTGSTAKVSPSPLVQEFVDAAIQAGFGYPAEFVREIGIRQDTLHYFIIGKTVPLPENMARLVSGFPSEVQNVLWCLYGVELKKGKGSFVTVRGTESARMGAINAYKTRRNIRESNGKI